MRLPTTANFLLHALDVVALVVALSMAIAGARMVAAAPSEIGGYKGRQSMRRRDAGALAAR